MQFRTFAPLRPQRVPAGQTIVRPALLLLLGVLWNTPPLRAQQVGNASADTDKQTIQTLLQRIERLEARVTQLEAARQNLHSAPSRGRFSNPGSSPVDILSGSRTPP